MNDFFHTLIVLLILVSLAACHPRMTLERTKTQIDKKLGRQQGTFAIAFKDLTTGEELLIGEHEQFHAASTMKTPVMIEVFKQASEGRFALTDSVLIKNEFRSIVDSSAYKLKSEGDSEKELYVLEGTKRTVSDLVYAMITMSSNFATNLIVERVGAGNVTQTMRDLGAADIQVVRGVEDSLAYSLGCNNTTTAFDLMMIYQKMAAGETVSPQASQAMIAILSDQKFAEIIPAGLPKGVTVAHKTGSLTGVHHDSGIVMLRDGRKYVLVILSKDLADDKTAIKAMARVSKLIYRHVMTKSRQE
jgi:beta-lactamase class A